MIRKIINRTHQDVDFVADTSESEKRNVELQSGQFPILKLPFWV